jgi:hypothetical protein
MFLLNNWQKYEILPMPILLHISCKGKDVVRNKKEASRKRR